MPFQQSLLDLSDLFNFSDLSTFTQNGRPKVYRTADTLQKEAAELGFDSVEFDVRPVE